MIEVILITHSLLTFGSRTLRHITHCKRPILDLSTIKNRHFFRPSPLRLLDANASEADWFPQAFEVYFGTKYPSGYMVRCFSSPHVCYTFMKHLFSKSTELAFKALLLSTGKYQLLISG